MIKRDADTVDQKKPNSTRCTRMRSWRCNQRKSAETHRLNNVIIYSETRKPLTRYHVILQLTNFSRWWGYPTLSYRRSYRCQEISDNATSCDTRYIARFMRVVQFACITFVGFAHSSRQASTANPYRGSSRSRVITGWRTIINVTMTSWRRA